jgi:hypothetical protein
MSSASYIIQQQQKRNEQVLSNFINSLNTKRERERESKSENLKLYRFYSIEFLFFKTIFPKVLNTEDNNKKKQKILTAHNTNHIST